PPPPTLPLSLHDALPILPTRSSSAPASRPSRASSPISGRASPSRDTSPPPGERLSAYLPSAATSSAASSTSFPIRSSSPAAAHRSEEHTSELQSPAHLVC